MTAFIGNLIAGAASSMMRGAGTGQGALAALHSASILETCGVPIIVVLWVLKIKVSVKL